MSKPSKKMIQSWAKHLPVSQLNVTAKIMLGRSFTLKGKDNEDRGEVETVPELSPHIIEKS